MNLLDILVLIVFALLVAFVGVPFTPVTVAVVLGVIFALRVARGERL